MFCCSFAAADFAASTAADVFAFAADDVITDFATAAPVAGDHSADAERWRHDSSGASCASTGTPRFRPQ